MGSTFTVQWVLHCRIPGAYTRYLERFKRLRFYGNFEPECFAAISSSFEATICRMKPTLSVAQTLNESGVYTGIFGAASGCDSTVTLTLTVLPASFSSIAATICASETYPFNGVVLTQTGSYTATYTGANGCDSIVTLDLTVLSLPQGAFAAVVCDGQSFEFNGEILTENGVYDFILEDAAANGCDSVVTLFLSIFPSIPPTTVNASICRRQILPNQWPVAHCRRTIHLYILPHPRVVIRS